MGGEVVLAASALIALLLAEAGSDAVQDRLDGAMISAVNVAEVADRFARDGVSGDSVRKLIQQLQIGIVAADIDLAFAVSELFQSTRYLGLSLGDRFCLALAQQMQRPALTADRRWQEAGNRLGISVELIR
jgi:ribonuclease VapC